MKRDAARPVRPHAQQCLFIILWPFELLRCVNFWYITRLNSAEGGPKNVKQVAQCAMTTNVDYS